MTILEEIFQQARQSSGRVAVVEGDREGAVARCADYAEVARAIERGWARQGTGQEGGVRPGSRCGLVAAQGIDFVLHGLEIMATGACFFPISSQVTGATLDSLVQRVKLHHVVTGGSWQTRPHPGDVDGQGDEVFRSLHPAFIRFTSGTTHTNKGVILGHEALVARIHAANHGLGIGPEDRVLWLLPMAHHWVVSILLYLSRGASILVPSEGGASALALARRQRASVIYASPGDYARLADASGSAGGRSTFPPEAKPRLAVSTASGLSPALCDRVQAGLGLTLVQALGMMEVGLPAINRTQAEKKPMSVGRPLPDYKIWLRSEQGVRVSGLGPEHTGEVMVEGPGFYSAYMDPWRLAEPGAFATGDQGYFDGEGDLFIVGRRKNRIVSGGMKFFCEEVEQEIERHPAVAACRVMARPDARSGEVPIVEVEHTPGGAPVSARDLAAFLHGRLPPHMIPVEVRRVDRIPRTPTGKVQRW